MDKLRLINGRIGNTPCVPLSHPHIDLFAKLEYFNFIGSIKDRAAYHIIEGAIENGDVDRETTIIEASSGNFALSVGAICNVLGLKFVAVIDPGINRVYEKLIRYFSADVLKVEVLDENGGYLLTKLEEVRNYCHRHKNTFWTNQYENENNFRAHYHGTGAELCRQFQHLDYAFMGVASGGTISGTSTRLKEHFPGIKVVAVDPEGSVIFGNPPKPRLIPGMGSGMVPPLIKKALIDDVVTVPEPDTLEGCRQIFQDHALFVGGSTGSIYFAVQKYFSERVPTAKRPKVVFICPDRGIGYADNVYDPEWLVEFKSKRIAAGLDPAPLSMAER